MLYWLTYAVTALGVRYAPPGAITVAPSPQYRIQLALAFLERATLVFGLWITDSVLVVVVTGLFLTRIDTLHTIGTGSVSHLLGSVGWVSLWLFSALCSSRSPLP